MMEAKKLAREELTAWSELAKDESIVSISFHHGVGFKARVR